MRVAQRAPLLVLAVAASFATAGCHPRRTDARPEPAAIVRADEHQLRAIMASWWPAYIGRDSAWFEAVLAPDFVQLRSYHHEWELDRKGFRELARGSAPCGPGTAFQVKFARYRVLDRHALVTQSVTFWVGEPTLSQSEMELTHLFEKRHGRWKLVEARYVWYQLPAEAWAPPDTMLPAADEEHPYNPEERPVLMDTLCRPEWVPYGTEPPATP